VDQGHGGHSKDSDVGVFPEHTERKYKNRNVVFSLRKEVYLFLHKMPVYNIY
jgi:hypothetical protein